MRALIAMSGGVDSSVAAYLTMQAGFSCVGATMCMCRGLVPEDSTSPADDASAVADRLGIPFHAIDVSPDFLHHVVQPFIESYERGDTPNPCIQCNRYMKFGVLLDQAERFGCDCIVTGHYARIRLDSATGRYLLYRAADEGKDQTYFLACLNQQQLSRIRLPLGELTKQHVRQIAHEQGFLNARKRDSQDICFIPDGDYKAFMERYTGKTYPPGDYVDLQGNPVGRHDGAVGYTLGQRRGLGIAMGQPVYVCGKDMQRNTVTIGPNEQLMCTTLRADDWNWLPFPTLTAPLRVTGKVRYRHKAQSATVFPESDGFARVEFDRPQRAITTGQAVVLYDGDMVIGGGTIRQVL